MASYERDIRHESFAARPASFLELFVGFARGSLRTILHGSPLYWSWLLLLALVIGVGVAAYSQQVVHGLIVTHLRDQLSWGFYIGNFAYLVGVAAAAVVLVIPAYVYHWDPIRQIVLIGELRAVSAIVMAILFGTVDIGRPQLVWHMLPFVGHPNFPYSMLVWDVLALSSYLVVNLFVVSYILYKSYSGRRYSPRIVLPIVFLSIPLAVSIHTVTAFLFTALPARTFWHTAILAPRFLVSAFCSGPALMILVFKLLQRSGRMVVPEAAIQKVAEMILYAMAANLFFIGAEAFNEFYYRTAHSIHAEVQWFGSHHLGQIAVYSWVALAFDLFAFLVFLIPSLRRTPALLIAACVMTASGGYVEKGLALVVPGMTPDMLGEFYAYQPSLIELAVGAGIWALGTLLFTWMLRVALAVDRGTLRHPGVDAAPAHPTPHRGDPT